MVQTAKGWARQSRAQQAPTVADGQGQDSQITSHHRHAIEGGMPIRRARPTNGWGEHAHRQGAWALCAAQGTYIDTRQEHSSKPERQARTPALGTCNGAQGTKQRRWQCLSNAKCYCLGRAWAGDSSKTLEEMFLLQEEDFKVST